MVPGFTVLGAPSIAAGYDGDLVLAVSWQPAFCETRPERPECRSQTTDRFDATHFALHGLWPQPRGAIYCGYTPSEQKSLRSTPWSRLPALALSETTRSALERAMPGTRSYLQRHQWVKHGTCYSDTPEIYFGDALFLLAELNGSALRELFVEGIGLSITADDIRASAAKAFGEAASQKVTVHCREDGRRRLIIELRLHLRGPIEPESSLMSLLAAGPEQKPGCREGIVDPAGLQ